MVLLVGGEHDQEEAVFRGRRETRYVEHRMIGHGQAVECEHAENGRDPGEEDRHFKRDHDECGPRVIRLALGGGRLVDRRHPTLHEVSPYSADQSADQHDERNFVVMESDFLGQSFDGERAIGVDLLIPGLMRGVSRINEGLRGIELRHDAVNRIALHLPDLAIIPSPRLRVEGYAFRRWRWRAVRAGTGTWRRGTCRWCRCRSSNPNAWGSTCPRRNSGSNDGG